ncbi:Chromosome partition protein Smc [compost metagenome]
MSKRKKKPSAADNLIESLMDDLKEIQSEASYHHDAAEGLLASSEESSEASSRENTNIQTSNVWDNLEKNISSNLDEAEFPGDVEEMHNYSSEVQEDDSYGNSEHNEYSSADESVEMSGLPDGFDSMDSLPASEQFNGPEAFEGGYDGPAVGDGGFQSSGDLADEAPSALDSAAEERDDSTKPVYSSGPAPQNSDKTVSLQQDPFNVMSSVTGTSNDGDKTIAVDGFANAKLGARKKPDVDVKVSIGGFRGGRSSSNVMTSMDASLVQAENLKIAQQRILELEKEVEVLRAENEELASAGDIIRGRADELGIRVSAVEKEKQENQESAQSEILILKGNLQYKESEVAKARLKIEELETRLKSDFKKIRVRERELENRLELLRAEKSALVRSKDEYILDLKRKIDQLSMELDNYRKKCLELNKAIDANQDQVKRTERALRLALSNLETKEENLVPLKKAE